MTALLKRREHPNLGLQDAGHLTCWCRGGAEGHPASYSTGTSAGLQGFSASTCPGTSLDLGQRSRGGKQVGTTSTCCWQVPQTAGLSQRESPRQGLPAGWGRQLGKGRQRSHAGAAAAAVAAAECWPNTAGMLSQSPRVFFSSCSNLQFKWWLCSDFVCCRVALPSSLPCRSDCPVGQQTVPVLTVCSRHKAAGRGAPAWPETLTVAVRTSSRCMHACVCMCLSVCLSVHLSPQL